MPDVLIATDAPWMREAVESVLSGPDLTIRHITTGGAVRAAVHERPPDIAVVDLQIGNMGGMAVCPDLRLEESGGRIPHVPVLMLLDRRADVFLARRSAAEAWLVKPLDPIRLRRAIDAVLAGREYHDNAYLPVQVPLPDTMQRSSGA